MHSYLHKTLFLKKSGCYRDRWRQTVRVGVLDEVDGRRHQCAPRGCLAPGISMSGHRSGRLGRRLTSIFSGGFHDGRRPCGVQPSREGAEHRWRVSSMKRSKRRSRVARRWGVGDFSSRGTRADKASHVAMAAHGKPWARVRMGGGDQHQEQRRRTRSASTGVGAEHTWGGGEGEHGTAKRWRRHVGDSAVILGAWCACAEGKWLVG
jgi:hypothetical protein